MPQLKLKPVPKVALPIIAIIRRETEIYDLPPLRQCETPLRFIGGFCPMGLCRKSLDRTPIGPTEFPYRISGAAVIAFAAWWDKIPAGMARKAVDRVWGRKKAQ